MKGVGTWKLDSFCAVFVEACSRRFTCLQLVTVRGPRGSKCTFIDVPLVSSVGRKGLRGPYNSVASERSRFKRVCKAFRFCQVAGLIVLLKRNVFSSPAYI